jgi:hypothetical protein
VVARDDEDGDSQFRDLQQGLNRLVHQGAGHPRPVEQVSTMDHHVDASASGQGQGPAVVRKEVMAPPAALHPGPGGQVEAQMGIGQEKHTNCSRRSGHFAVRVGFGGMEDGPALDKLAFSVFIRYTLRGSGVRKKCGSTLRWLTRTRNLRRGGAGRIGLAPWRFRLKPPPLRTRRVQSDRRPGAER